MTRIEIALARMFDESGVPGDVFEAEAMAATDTGKALSRLVEAVEVWYAIWGEPPNPRDRQEQHDEPLYHAFRDFRDETAP